MNTENFSRKCFKQGTDLPIKRRRELVSVFYKYFQLKRMINSLLFELAVLSCYIVFFRITEGEWFKQFHFKITGYIVIYMAFVAVVVAVSNLFKYARTSARIIRKIREGKFMWRTAKVTGFSQNKKVVLLNRKGCVALNKKDVMLEFGTKFIVIVFPDFLPDNYAVSFDYMNLNTERRG